MTTRLSEILKVEMRGGVAEVLSVAIDRALSDRYSTLEVMIERTRGELMRRNLFAELDAKLDELRARLLVPVSPFDAFWVDLPTRREKAK